MAYEKRTVFDFAIYVMKKHINGRKLAILEINDKMTQVLAKYGISEYDSVVFDKEKAKDNVIFLGDLKGKGKEYYILVPEVFRDTNRLKQLRDLGFQETEDFFFCKGSKRYVTEEMYVNVQPGDTMNFLAVVTAGRVHFILITLEEIAMHLADKKVRFFILHSPNARGEIGQLLHRTGAYSNIEVIAYEVSEGEECQKLTTLCNPKSWWPREVFYKFLAYRYLPKDVNRILYIDTGDAMITGNIDAFYWDDFEGKTFLVHHEWENSGKRENDGIVLHSREDLFDGNIETVQKILRGVTNTGCFLINLDKMRQDGYTIKDYSAFVHKIYEMYGRERVTLFFLDQSLLSTFYLGDMKYHRLNEMQDFWFNPYNFVLYFYDLDDHIEPYYSTPVVHFTGMKTVKPWQIKYPCFFKHFQQKEHLLYDVKELRYSTREYYYQWMYYVQKAEERYDNDGRNRSLSYLLSYRSEVEFSFDPNIWERQYILGRSVLMTRNPEPGKPASLPLSERLKRGKIYSLEARIKVKTTSEWLNIHIQNAKSREYQVVCYRNTADCNNRWIAFRRDFVPDADIYDTLMFDASQVKGEDSFLAIDYLCITEKE